MAASKSNARFKLQSLGLKLSFYFLLFCCHSLVKEMTVYGRICIIRDFADFFTSIIEKELFSIFLCSI